MSGDNFINRRAILWNVQQPGDPYDIRKSMIAKLPEHPARFMGNNLQIVCLFQAAQIQRLAQFLDEMTLEMRAIERIQLDRHSYQVQIKQLAQKLQLANSYKAQNQKLRQFIKGQSQELESLKRYRNSSQNLLELQTKYESVLNQLRTSRENYSVLQRTNNQSLKQIAQWRFKCQKLQKSLHQQRQIRERQSKILIEKTTLEIKSFFESKQYQLKGEINVMKENLVLKNRQIQFQKSRNQQLSKILAEKQQLIGKYSRGQVQGQVSRTQQFLQISRRLEQQTYYLEQKQKNILSLKDEIAYLNKKIKTIEDELRRKQDQLKLKEEDFKRKEQQIQQRSKTFNNNPELLVRISENQNKISFLSSQIERLNQVINLRNNEFIEKEKQISFYKEKSVSFQMTVEYLQKELKQKQTIIKRFQYDSHIFEDKDNKIAALGSEIERLNIVMREKLNQISRNEHRFNQLSQSYNQQFNLLRAREEAINILQQKCKNYENKIISLEDKTKLNMDEINRLHLEIVKIQNINIQVRRQLESKSEVSSEMTQLKIKISDLNKELQKKTDENRKLREDNQIMFKDIHEMQEKTRLSQINFNDVIYQKDQQIKNYQINLSEKDNYYLQKIDMYSNSIPKMSMQIERLQQMVQRKQADLKRLQQDLQKQRQKISYLEQKGSTQNEMRFLEYEKKISFYESKYKSLQKINADLSEEKNFITQKVQHLQIKLKQSQMEIQKIFSSFKTKEIKFQQQQKNIAFLQSSLHQLRQENLRVQSQSLRYRQQLEKHLQMIKKIQFQLDLSKRDIQKAEVNRLALVQENSKLKSLLEQNQQKNPVLVQTIQNLKHQIQMLGNENQHLMQQINDKKHRLQLYEEDLRTYQAKVSEHQQSLKHIEQANSIKIQEFRQRFIQDFDVKMRNQSLKYNELQQMFRQVQNRLNQNMNNLDQNHKNLQNLQIQNGELVKHLNDYQQKVFSYEQKFVLLSQEIQRLRIQNSEWKRKYEQKDMSGLREEERKRLNQELQSTRIEVINLKNMLDQYGSMNEHTIAERDELFEITHEQQGKIKIYENQISRLNNELARFRNNQGFQNTEMGRLKQQYNLLMEQYGVLKGQYSSLSYQMQQSNRKAEQLNRVTERQRQFQNQQSQNRLRTMKQNYELTLSNEKCRITQLEANLQSKNKNIANLQRQNSDLKLQINSLQLKISQFNETMGQIQELKTAYINIKLENQELNRMLEQMQEQLFDAKSQTERLNQEYRENAQLKLQSMVSENTQLKSILQQERQTLFAVQQKLSHLSTQVDQTKSDAELKIRTLENNFNIVQNQNLQLKQEIDSLRQQLTQSLVYQQISTQLQAKYNTLYQAYQQTYNIYNLLKVQHQSTTENLHLTENKIHLLNDEFNKFNVIISQLKNEILRLQQENQQLKANSVLNQNQYHQLTINYQELQRQLQRVYKLNEDLTNQVAEIRLRLCDQHTLEEKIKQNMVLFVIMCAEIQSLRKRVFQTEHQCEEVRRSSISPLKTKK